MEEMDGLRFMTLHCVKKNPNFAVYPFIWEKTILKNIPRTRIYIKAKSFDKTYLELSGYYLVEKSVTCLVSGNFVSDYSSLTISDQGTSHQFYFNFYMHQVQISQRHF